MSDHLLNLFANLGSIHEDPNRSEIIRAPFGYPGGKSRSVKEILKHLPYRKKYVEPFAGSACVLLNRERSKIEVLNDRYAGVTSFYRCLRNKDTMDALVSWLRLTVHSREDFEWCKKTWEECTEDVERAARWYYTVQTSFGCLGRAWARSTDSNVKFGVHGDLESFGLVHSRLQGVHVENLDWRLCALDYDSDDCVHYFDPPYLNTDPGCYRHKFTEQDHINLLDTAHNLKGFVAISHYQHPLYDSYKWSERHFWKSFVSSNVNKDERTHATECLYIV